MKIHISKESMEQMKRFLMGERTRLKTADEPEVIPEEAEEASASVSAAVRSDKGSVRPTNQDAVLCINDGHLALVADGMGGHKGGETASSLACETVQLAVAGQEADADVLCDAVLEANKAIYHRQENDSSLSGMGTTLTAVWLGQEAIIAHVGDSRCYLLRDGEIRQMTDDHSMVAEMVRSGILTKHQAETHPMRNIITRAVGTDAELEVDMITEPRQHNDIWLVCSDGLCGVLSDQDMADIMTKYPLQMAADRLLAMALEAGSTDNISLVLLRDREVSE